MEIAYVGEHLLYGKIGNALIILSFTMSILSTLAYLFSVFRKKDDVSTWIPLARTAYMIHGAAVFGIIGLIFYLIHGHFFEYYYVWQHSNTTLPVKYMWACFWEGQEGSFLLWTFWHVVLGAFFVFRKNTWESPVMMILMMIQVFLASMVLGIDVFGFKLGSNPFILLRNQADFANLPFVHFPDYLSKITDGRGLNPLLQNYWMVIHPPTLFLGFASTAIPFAFAMGGLLANKPTEWVRPALPWGIFSIMILGTGILMGGAWAYEALSFGGFWAWDPVENASLVPWLLMAGLVHVMLIYLKRNEALMTTFVLAVATFILVLYSTFLTRSGILGNTSVHAFTDLGMTGQLLLYMLFFTVLSIVLLIVHRKSLRSKPDEEHLMSREFWMFMGMLVLLISAIQVTFTTSIPVINKVFGTNLAPPADAISFYNSWQLPLASITALLIAIGQYFKWKKTETKEWLRKLTISFIIALVITVALTFYYQFARPQFVFMAFTTVWAIIANADYLIRILKGKVRESGASIAHIGMGMILLGALISNAQQQVISKNMLNVDMGKDFPNNQNILLYQHDTLPMGEYYVTYTGSSKEGVNVLYHIDYLKADHEKGGFNPAFTLKPFVQINQRMGNVSEPATRHFWNKDIYTHITYAELEEEKKGPDANDAYKEATTFKVAPGDTFSASNSMIIVDAIDKDINKDSLFLNPEDLAVGIDLRIIDVNKTVRYAKPVFILRGNNSYSNVAEVADLGLKFNFTKILPEEGKMELQMAEKKSNKRDFIIMKAIIFPAINILWAGCLLMIIGTWIAIRKRIGQLKPTV